MYSIGMKKLHSVWDDIFSGVVYTYEKLKRTYVNAISANCSV